MRRPAPGDPTAPSCASACNKRNKIRIPATFSCYYVSVRSPHIAADNRAAYLERGAIVGTGKGQVLQLTDGSEVVVRPIGPDDASLLQAFVRRLSARSRRFRFFVTLAELSAAQMDRLVNVDPARGLALVALSGRQEGTAIVAEARYALAQENDIAEFAIAVADDFQGRGLGRRLVKRLLATAWRRGVRGLFGEIKSDNRAMLAFAMQLGFRLRSSLQDESVVVASMPSLTYRIGSTMAS